MEKQCPRCGKIKHTSEFYKRGDGSDGFRRDCKKCYNLLRKKRYDEDADYRANRISQISDYNQTEVGRQKHRDSNNRYARKFRSE